MAYRLSDSGLSELKRVEGVRYAVYDDKTGKPINSYEEAGGTPTIGMGLAIQNAEDREKYRPYLGNRKAPADVIDAANKQKVAQFESRVNSLLGPVALTQSMFDAIFHFAWNVGTNSSYLKKVAAANTLRAVQKRSTAFVRNLFHRQDGNTVSSVIRRCRSAEYRVWGFGV